MWVIAPQLERCKAQRHEQRFLKLSQQEDGALWLQGWLDPEGGSLLRSALEPLARPCGKADDRTREQRLADALCARHHRLHHEGGWRLLHKDGKWTALRPPPTLGPTWPTDLPEA